LSFGLFARWSGLPFSIDPTEAMKVLSPLLLTAGFIERAVEVVISPWRDAGANKLTNALNVAKAAAPINQAAIETASDQLDTYKGKTQQYAFAASLTLGLAAAFVGVRALWPLLEQDKLGSFSWAQVASLKVYDVVLSAALLSGGAEGIHSVVSAFTSFFDAGAKKAKKSADA
jgi:hypothetical protein